MQTALTYQRVAVLTMALVLPQVKCSNLLTLNGWMIWKSKFVPKAASRSGFKGSLIWSQIEIDETGDPKRQNTATIEAAIGCGASPQVPSLKFMLRSCQLTRQIINPGHLTLMSFLHGGMAVAAQN